MKGTTVREGRWQNGVFMQGKIVSTDNVTREGEFADNKLVRGKITSSTGDVLEGEFKEGKLWTGEQIKKEGRVRKRWVEGQVVVESARKVVVEQPESEKIVIEPSTTAAAETELPVAFTLPWREY
eukprot:gene12513-14473_t